MSDTIANILTSIRNAQSINRHTCVVPYARQSEMVLNVLQTAGYISAVEKIEGDTAVDNQLQVTLIPGKIHKITRLSKPGRRVYVGYRDIPTVMRGFGTVIISTPNGMLTGKEAKAQKVGGELICEVA